MDNDAKKSYSTKLKLILDIYVIAYYFILLCDGCYGRQFYHTRVF